MEKRKNVILSAITCFVSICMLMLGVYAASSPSVSIGGQVSYTARDAKVLVQGKVNGVKGQSSTVDYPSATVTSNAVTATKVANSSTQYLDYTAGTGNSEQDVLSPWKIGTLEFAEDSTGVKDITISFKLTNLSTYPVQATLTFPSGATGSDLASANVSRTANVTTLYLAQNGGSGQLNVIYKLTSDSQSIPSDATNLLGMNIVFEKAAPPSSYTLSNAERTSAKITMGKQSSTSTAEDVQWRCFAYSIDGNTWTKLDSGASIPTTAKYGYFALDTYVKSLEEEEFLAQSKYSKNSSDNNYYINAGENGVTTANTVYANDYYYSDIRQTLKGLESSLSVDQNSDIYKAICGRTVEDLYKLNLAVWKKVGGESSQSSSQSLQGIKRISEPEIPETVEWVFSEYADQSVPTNADSYTVDKFWLLSRYEADTYFADGDARKIVGNMDYYWLRSPYFQFNDANGNGAVGCLVGSGGDMEDEYATAINTPIYARPAFKLALT